MYRCSNKNQSFGGGKENSIEIIGKYRYCLKSITQHNYHKSNNFFRNFSTAFVTFKTSFYRVQQTTCENSKTTQPPIYGSIENRQSDISIARPGPRCYEKKMQLQYSIF